MATYGGVLRRSAAVVEHARDSARSTRLHYALLLWVLLLASLFPRRRATMLFLMAASKLALFYGALLRAFPNSALLRRIVDRRLVAALLMAVVGAEIVMTSAVPQFLLAMAVGAPLVLLHAVFRTQDDPAASGEDTAAGNGGELGPILEKKEDLELGSQ
ncbi:PRA1 family protein [Musa troglodytarum]|uniref:PRA1 family protein n=1 Tax=Musa troglodytarum TaxID=320322 RepID=A0A9E7EV52_9LILI|nr:PRA1 family protein [Musa troglodytarum]